MGLAVTSCTRPAAGALVWRKGEPRAASPPGTQPALSPRRYGTRVVGLR
jgi:hypothetical protein